MPTYLFEGDRLLGGLVQFFDGLGVVAKIHLAADEDDWKALAEVEDFGDPLEKEEQHQLPSLDHPSIITLRVFYFRILQQKLTFS